MSLAQKINLFEKRETTTINSPTKSVSIGPQSHTQLKHKFVYNNESRLKSNKYFQENTSLNDNISIEIDKNNSPELDGNAYHIEDNFVSHRNKMVAAKQEIVNETQTQQTMEVDENGVGLKYGPGFVSKLRYRYLSLTLRQTSVSKQRPSLAQLRRSTSLNNLLDEETEENDQDEQHHIVGDGSQTKAYEVNGNIIVPAKNLKNHNANGIEKPLTESYPPPTDGHHLITRASRSIDKSLNLKRARSVEAILRYDHTAWERDIQKDHKEQSSNRNSSDVTIEDKIQNARDRPQVQAPKRLMSLIDDDERPPPGICKQTMRIFETSANKKRSPVTRPIGQEIANKVALFKNQQEKPPIAAKKPNIIPRTTSPKTLNHLNNNNSSKTAMNNNEKFARFSKEKTVLPKLDINIIKNNLETKSNGSWSPADNKDSYRNVKLDYSPALSESSLSSTPTVLSPFRNSMSPQLNDTKKQDLSSTSSTITSPIITSLSSKLNNLHMETTSTPKTYNKSNNLLKLIDDPDMMNGGDKDASDNIHNNRNNINNNINKSSSSSNVESVSDTKSVKDESKTLSFIPKINNNIGTNNGKFNYEKLPADNKNVDVKTVKENFVITKPTQAPPPPPPYIMKSQQSRDNSNDKSSIDSKNSVDSSEQSKVVEETATPKWTVKKKSWSAQNNDDTANTIVFNFSDRKDVPDYIEHDGLILRRRRELPKPNESGFVLLGDLTLDSSTDPDDAYQMGPPSPCDVEFENANIVPDGKSSIRTRSKEVKLCGKIKFRLLFNDHINSIDNLMVTSLSAFKIQFDDSLTATFEYPSETSLMIDETFGDEDEIDANFYARSNASNSSSKLMTTVPFGSTPFANYQPQKANGTTFELGITRTTPSPSSASSDENTFISNPESDGEDYLKPATDEESQRWSSEGTKGTDLLF
ncbi:CLUMA_CG005744, isoform A [Clunio marinus]|uniref:CLUMA_CG005744, isoform A n=1 Tax=Clunio marinus TaxID=568069 RepID=A0A1J1HW88_9DIPT|nr:CLUMA_CG005744, isoform A [Clunio marinus]